MRKLSAAAQEERRRQVVGLRESGLTYEAIAAQVGLTRTGVFNICRRFAEQGRIGRPWGPAPAQGGFSSLSRKRRSACRNQCFLPARLMTTSSRSCLTASETA
jgi:transposase